MTRNERITQARRVQAARDMIRSHGTAAQIERSHAYDARGRVASVLTIAADVAAITPRTAYALASA